MRTPYQGLERFSALNLRAPALQAHEQPTRVVTSEISYGWGIRRISGYLAYPMRSEDFVDEYAIIVFIRTIIV